MSTGGTSATSVFAGNSRYASDFQAIIDRTVAIASLPISQLNNQRTGLSGQSAALSALDGKFTALQTALSSVEKALGTASFRAEVSKSAVLSATVSDGAMEGTYSVKVISLGACTNTLSPPPNGTTIAKVADPAAAAPTQDTAFTLTVDGKARTIRPAGKTLNALAAAINADADANVRAAVVNVGSPDAPDYRLSVQSSKLGPVGITLTAGSVSLLEEQSKGAKATYNVNGAKVNGVEQVASSDTRTVQIAPGLTVTLLEQNADPVNITVKRQASAVSDALSAFANAYNAAVDELDKHRGAAGGALTGQAIVYSLSQTLAQVGGYSGSGAVSSLKDLGLDVDKAGHILFSSAAFSGTDSKYPGGIAEFLGSSAKGGFLKGAADTLKFAEDPLTGALQSEIRSVKSQISGADERIAAQQALVDDMKLNLMEKMAAADAMIASMEQQYNYISSMFESMRVASQSYG